MPIHVHAPWRREYFKDVACPADVDIPVDDGDAYRWNPLHRWVYNKLLVAESQGLPCAPHGVAPTSYPVFSKPIVNLEGMGVGSRLLKCARDYESHSTPGHLWMQWLEGEHISTDAAVIRGVVHWMRHARGFTLPGGTFDHWIIEAAPREALAAYCTDWITRHLATYTGVVNLETIGGRIIEAHLRFSDQWPDLYGSGWLDAMVLLYSHAIWDFADPDRRDGYSLALFGPHGLNFKHPDPQTQLRVRSMPAVSSLQITFHEDRPAASQAMPPDGFRLAVINCWEHSAGVAARAALARALGPECQSA
jgi:hypothetical protein